jgi:hypothetical protein
VPPRRDPRPITFWRIVQLVQDHLQRVVHGSSLPQRCRNHLYTCNRLGDRRPALSQINSETGRSCDSSMGIWGSRAWSGEGVFSWAASWPCQSLPAGRERSRYRRCPAQSKICRVSGACRSSHLAMREDRPHHSPAKRQ